MIRDGIISTLVAERILRIPWFAECDNVTKFSIWLATTVCLFIFCLFVEMVYEKRREYKKRVQKIKEEVERLRHEKREIAGNHRSIGRKPGYAIDDADRQ